MINQNRYVRIISGVGAGAPIAQRQLILRLITQNTVIPPKVVAEFTTPDDVGRFFGINSEEYKRAVKYFGFVSKTATSPSVLSFSRWVSVAIPATIVGNTNDKSLAAIKALGSTAVLNLVSNGTNVQVKNMALASATSLTDVAAAVTTAMNATTDVQVKGGACTFNTNINQFVIAAASTGAGSGDLYAVSSSSNDLAALMGIVGDGVTNVSGQQADDPTQAVQSSANISNNFGSFVFCTPNPALTAAQRLSIASWNKTQNNMYMFGFSVTKDNLQSEFANVGGIGGTAIGVRRASQADDFIDQAPFEILAATDYTKANASQNYMFYQFPNRNVVVTTDQDADFCDANRGNYIGITQSSGQGLAFYQRGVLCGGSADALDMNVYANEMWLKSSIAANIMGLFLGVNRVPANDEGEAMLLAVIQTVVDQAKLNKTISAGKKLNVVQQQFISQTTGDPTAWRQVATSGYWLSIEFQTKTTTDNRTEYYASYTLVYSKDDAVRFVQGRDILI